VLDHRGTSDVVIRHEVELGVPHLGPHALGESQMLKLLGYLRWESFQRLAGVPISRVVDGQGRRLYATFYHVDIEFPPSAPPHAFRENDRVVWLGDLSAYGRNILDGHFALYRTDDRRAEGWGVPREASRLAFLEAGIPVIRLSNIFITQESGPHALKVGQPANADLSRIRATVKLPDGHARNKQAREKGRFFEPPDGARPYPAAGVTFDHPIDPDRDVNAAGLVYFGNFPAFFAVAERRALGTLADGGLPRPLVDRRGTRRRLIAFFGNARADDQLRIRVECAIVPEPIYVDTPPRPYGRMWFSLGVTRLSDHRVIAISTAERITPLDTEEGITRWRAYAERLP
jgi:probable biosynthetic protein (TIGR04098 family)